MQNAKPEKNKSSLNDYAKYSNISAQMLIVIGLGVWGGVRLDKFVAWRFPVFTVLLSLGAVFLAIYIVIKDLLKK